MSIVSICRLVDLICDKMSESLESDPTLGNAGKGTTRLTNDADNGAGGCSC